MEKGFVRPPIVVVLGHVDHGKTSLLDAIRKTSVVRREAGGITQSIGASVAITKDKRQITFIDTPGHALFTKMRSRGVGLADIAVLVVAGDDGVQPQTKEALKLLQESGTSFIVALTKIDLPTAATETVLGQLEKEGVYFEKRGGDISWIGVSSKTGKGIDELLELISLVSDLKGLVSNPASDLDGFVIETSKDKRGLLVSVVVKDGKISVGDIIFAGELQAKVRGLFDDSGKPIKQVMPGYPALILGFGDLPEVGAKIGSKLMGKILPVAAATARQGEAKIKIFVKAKTAGGLEALLANVPQEVEVIGSGVGDLIESDIFLAKAGSAIVFLFESKMSSNIRRLSETEGVEIERFDVVYDLIERLKELVEKGKEEIVGKAQIITTFPFDGKKVAGSKIINGKIAKADHLKLMRGEGQIGKVKVISIKKQKQEVNEVKQGEECGILFEPQLDFQIGDVLLSVKV